MKTNDGYSTNTLDHYRILLGIGATIYGAWGPIYTFTVPNAHDPLSGRLAMAALGWTLVALTYFNSWCAEKIEALCIPFALLITGHIIYLCNINNLHPGYVIGVCIVVLACITAFNTFRYALLFGLISTAIFIANAHYFKGPTTYPTEIFSLALLSSVVLTTFAQQGRFKAIKKLKEAQTKIMRQQSQLLYTSKMVALGELADGIAHQINSPLTAIQLMAEEQSVQIDRGSFDKTKILILSHKIVDTCNRMSKIIKGLRSFTRDPSSDPFTKVEVRSVIDMAFSLCSEKLKEKQIILDFAVPDDLKMECRPAEISQVLLNLINNSAAAVADENQKWIALNVTVEGKTIVMRVSDSGKGIPETMLNKLFQPFFSTKPLGKGTGLGLSYSRGVVESYNGTLSYDKKAKHTTFEIVLPKEQEALNQAA